MPAQAGIHDTSQSVVESLWTLAWMAAFAAMTVC